MKNLRVLILILGITAGLSAAERPNVLFIAIDDLKPMLGCYDDPDVLSPNIDRLAERGTVFLNNACQQAICGPSRASLMTGLYPDSTRVFDLQTRMRDVNPDVLTLPEHFRKQGYATTGVGKIYDSRCVDQQLDEPSWSIPYAKLSGQDYSQETGAPFNGFHDPRVRQEHEEIRRILKQKGIPNNRSNKEYQTVAAPFLFRKPVVECLEENVPYDAYTDGAVLNRATGLLRDLAKNNQPFFLGVGFSKPHLPFVAPKQYWDLYDRDSIELAPFQEQAKGAPDFAYQPSWELRSYSGVPASGPIDEAMQRDMIHGYRACVSYVDDLVGRLVAQLDTFGLSENTIIVLWGDHGWHLGDHGMFCKHTNYEQAVRSPLIIVDPAQRQKGSRSDSPTEFIDIFPTLCELAGLPAPEQLEGHSLVSIMDNSNAMVREASLAQYPRYPSRMGYTLRDKRYRYIKWVDNDYKNGSYAGSVRAVELYDYQSDPLETVNQASNPDYQEVVTKFERLFEERGVAQQE
ncbi:MAG: sulfatase [Puniceicoccaceae bacterium]|jgi:arylsulfatase A-like enzyme|nr:sulfatase [Puniceicoccaceae bacterium]